jgi:hypothetical protein
MDEMRILSEEECETNEDIGILHNDKIFRLNKKRIMVEREGSTERSKKDKVLKYSRSKGVYE